MSQGQKVASSYSVFIYGGRGSEVCACSYFLAQVSHLHGRGQLESCKYKKCNLWLCMVMEAEAADVAVVVDAFVVMVGQRPWWLLF
jgi:hypothetical protein